MTAQRETSAPGARSIRVLVADDHAVIRHGVRALLVTEPGFEVCAEAETAAETLDAVARTEPDVVVLDLTLPDLNGFEASGRILAVRSQTKILLFTMHESLTALDEAMAVGARGYLLKSEAEVELLHAIRSVARGETYLSPRLRGPADLPQRGPLTSREREVLRMIAEGRTTRALAGALGISLKTADTHRTNLMRKLNVHSVSDLVRYAVRNGMIRP